MKDDWFILHPSSLILPEMTFVFPLLLGGLLLTGIPVLLHLIVRQKPKRLPFPAFRFLVQQQRTNLRKLRLRHLLLLALRVFLIAAMCLLLARPRLFHDVLGLDGERPVRAVLLFDTSASMEYRSSDGMTRLAAAQDRAHEFLKELPAESEIVVVDSASAQLDQPLKWLPVHEVDKRINELQIRYVNAPVSQALARVLGRLDETEPDKGDRAGPPRLKLVAVLSDRTRGSWDGGQLPALVDKLDRIMPTYDGLMAARGQIGPLKDLLAALPAGKGYGAQTLVEALTALADQLTVLAPQRDSWPTDLPASVQQVRRLSRELLAQLTPSEAAPDDAVAKVRTALTDMLRATSGAQMLFIDVGIESPVAITLGALELPRNSQGTEQQLFAEGDAVTLSVPVQAIGKDVSVKLVCQIGDSQQEFDAALKAGQQPQLVPFNLGPWLRPGDNLIEVRIPTDKDKTAHVALPHSQQRFATVRIRSKTRVVVLVDRTEQADPLVKNLVSVGYAPKVHLASEVTADALRDAKAVYLFGVAAPSESVWRTLTSYVKAGGGLAIVPAGAELSKSAYNDPPAARALMPGTLGDKRDGRQPAGSDWDWATAKYTHSFLKRFKAWKDNERIDFVRYPRGAMYYWEVTEQPDALVLVKYDDANHRPAVLERKFTKSAMLGKTLLFTTPLDEQQPPWNNYQETISPSFYLAIVSEATAYLAGETVAPQLNFILGQGNPQVALPAGPALELVAELHGPGLLRPMPLEPGQTQLVFRDLAVPGNYQLDGKAKDGRLMPRLAAFSLNVPATEADLARVPAADIEPLFAGTAIIAPGPEVPLHETLQPYRSRPRDLMPYFMIALLLALALENLLSNKFYRQT